MRRVMKIIAVDIDQMTGNCEIKQMLRVVKTLDLMFTLVMVLTNKYFQPRSGRAGSRPSSTT